MMMSEQQSLSPPPQPQPAPVAPPQPIITSAEPNDEEPVPGDSEESKMPEPNAVRHFPHLVLPQPVLDVLDSVPPDRFDTIAAYGRQRWSKYIELAKAPADSTQWAPCVLGTQLMQTVGSKDRVLFVYDSKNMSDTLVPDRIVRPFKHPVPFQSKEFIDIATALWGDLSLEAEVRMNSSPFMWKGSASMFQAFDGRRPAATSKITSHCNKALKHVPLFRGSTVPLRLMYSN